MDVRQVKKSKKDLELEGMREQVKMLKLKLEMQSVKNYLDSEKYFKDNKKWILNYLG